MGDHKRNEENAATLELGPDFQVAKCLWNKEIAIILENQLDNRQNEADFHSESASNLVLTKTLDYVRELARYKNRETVSEARRLTDKYLTKYNLAEFETATLNNLGVTIPEEAFSLVPSLVGKIPEEALEQLLEDQKKCENA